MRRTLIVWGLAFLGCVAVGLALTSLATGEFVFGAGVVLGTGIGLALFAAMMILEDTVKLRRRRR